MAVGIDDVAVAASSEVSEVASSSTSVEILGDGIGEKSLGESLDESIEMPFGPSEQQSIDGDGIGEGTNDAATSEVSEVSSPSANTEGAEGGFGEGLDNSVEMPLDSSEQLSIDGDGIGEGADDAVSSEVSEVSIASANAECVEDGLGEDAIGKGLDNSVEIPFDSFEQQGIKGEGIGESTSDTAKVGHTIEGNGGETIHNLDNKVDPVDVNSLGDIKFDDNENPYMNDGGLLPNNKYDLNGFTYITDHLGRIIHGEGKVSINDSPRPSLPKIEGMETGDDRGHIIAHVLGGADTEGNLVPMESSLNRGEYKSMELSARNDAAEGKDVNLSVDIEYGEGKRPVSFTATLEIDDEITIKKFFN